MSCCASLYACAVATSSSLRALRDLVLERALVVRDLGLRLGEPLRHVIERVRQQAELVGGARRHVHVEACRRPRRAPRASAGASATTRRRVSSSVPDTATTSSTPTTPTARRPAARAAAGAAARSVRPTRTKPSGSRPVGRRSAARGGRPASDAVSGATDCRRHRRDDLEHAPVARASLACAWPLPGRRALRRERAAAPCEASKPAARKRSASDAPLARRARRRRRCRVSARQAVEDVRRCCARSSASADRIPTGRRASARWSRRARAAGAPRRSTGARTARP